jgi:signal transduction histidine kinase
MFNAASAPVEDKGMTGPRKDGDGDPARSRFLATMSHDIRTPLTALRGALGLLERDEVPADVARQMVEMLRRASSRFERLAFGLVAIDLIEDGSMPLAREVCDLRDLVHDAVTASRREHAAIRVATARHPVEVVVDRDRTMQALDHLLDNARKFGGPDGTVSVEVLDRGERGVVTISDEGPGIALAERARIFERYVQVGERLPNEPRGAGIGLYLARWSAEAMGGELRLLDGGAGASFELVLPSAASLDTRLL